MLLHQYMSYLWTECVFLTADRILCAFAIYNIVGSSFFEWCRVRGRKTKVLSLCTKMVDFANMPLTFANWTVKLSINHKETRWWKPVHIAKFWQRAAGWWKAVRALVWNSFRSGFTERHCLSRWRRVGPDTACGSVRIPRGSRYGGKLRWYHGNFLSSAV